MTDRVVLVTGGTRGLGLGIVERLLAEDFRVVAAARSCPPEMKARIAECEGRLAFEQLDLGDSASLHAFSQRFVQRYDVPFGLVNNAAVGHDGVLGTMHESQIAETIGVNVTGTIILTKYISRSMLRRRTGRIVNVSSIIASTGYSGLSVYAASKAALIGFTYSLARELGRIGITVNALAPGYMATDMTAGIGEEQLSQIRRRSALRRLPVVSEVAEGVAFLLGPAALSMTGTVLTMDSGNTA